MRILADENFPGIVVTQLRARGHDVLWARTDMPAAKDQDILDRARLEARIVVTFDKDFGELAVRRGLPASDGVVLFRLSAPSPESVAARILAFLDTPREWTGCFIVVEDERVRIRPLPRPSS
jgi:predicted nuclease of predicted toxin-antitoxin system